MPEGVGKSGYIHHSLADTYGYITCRDRALLKTMWLKADKRMHASNHFYFPLWERWEKVTLDDSPFSLFSPISEEVA